MINYTIRNTSIGGELLLYEGDFAVEAGSDFSPQKSVPIRRVRLLLASGVTVTLPLPQFTSAIALAEGGASFGASIFSPPGPAEQRQPLDAPQPLGLVCPAYFSLSVSGTLKQSGISRTFSQNMAQNGTAVFPLVTCTREGDAWLLTEGAKVGARLYALAKQYAFDGFIFDFPQSAGTAYTEFLAAAKGQLQDVSLGAVLYPAQNTYEYEKISVLSAYVLLNPLQKHAQQIGFPYYSAAEGERAVKKAIHDGIAHDKLVLALDLGARLCGAVRHGDIPLRLNDVSEITDSFAVKERYDPLAGATYLNFTLKPGQQLILASQRLSSGDFTINMGGGTYARNLLTLTRKHGIKGVVLLHLPLSPADLWDYFHVWLSGGYFETLRGTFGCDALLKTYVEAMLQGVGDTHFLPYNPITRGEAAVLLTRLLHLPSTWEKPPFLDISGHWAEKDIASAYFAGHIRSDCAKTFCPDAALNREEAAVLIARLSGIAERHRGESLFSPVAPDSAQGENVLALYRAGLLHGDAGGAYRPNTHMTQEEIARLIRRLEPILQS